uniref:Uncharacterized protein n=1 Tax=Rhipicephalus zambeziensis TaxID=60191 RepID=A0A224Y7S2_9ACAR
MTTSYIMGDKYTSFFTDSPSCSTSSRSFASRVCNILSKHSTIWELQKASALNMTYPYFLFLLLNRLFIKNIIPQDFLTVEGLCLPFAHLAMPEQRPQCICCLHKLRGVSSFCLDRPAIFSTVLLDEQLSFSICSLLPSIFSRQARYLA